MEDAQRQIAAYQEQAAQVSAQNQLLHVQLATANNEISILRALTSTSVATAAPNVRRRISRQHRQPTTMPRKQSTMPLQPPLPLINVSPQGPQEGENSACSSEYSSYSDDFESELGLDANDGHGDEVNASKDVGTHGEHVHHGHSMSDKRIGVTKALLVVAKMDELEKGAAAAQQEVQTLRERLQQQEQVRSSQASQERVRALAAEQRLVDMQTELSQLKVGPL